MAFVLRRLLGQCCVIPFRTSCYGHGYSRSTDLSTAPTPLSVWTEISSTPESIMDSASPSRLDVKNEDNKGLGPHSKQFIPPTRKGMTVLEKSAFNKDIGVPTIVIPILNLKKTLRSLNPFLLKAKRLHAVQDIPESKDKKRIYLNPDVVTDVPQFLQTLPELQNNQEILSSISVETVTLTYDNWKLGELMDSILPDDQDKFGGFTVVGRLVHVNLRDNLLPYKNIIGEIIMDKVPNVKTVVNKLVTIENTYRNFQMEVIAGDSETIVTVKENHVEFEFDFATVYWNSRLSSEHERIVVGYIKKGDTLFDVFAGVGPFAVPAAKKKCTVFANDLNPASFKWLCHNVTKNKVTEYLTAFNKDGQEFMLQEISSVLKSAMESGHVQNSFHVTMNLPALAVTFLKYFWNLLNQEKSDNCVTVHPDLKLVVHVYCFIKALEGHKEKALQLVKDELNYDLRNDQVLEVFFVRNVAPNKDMYRISFNLPHEILVSAFPAYPENDVIEDKLNPRKRKLSNGDTDAD